MITNKNKGRLLFIITAVLLSYLLWLFFRPVKIIAIHQDKHFSDIMVNHFPLTNRGKIIWWQENKDILKSRYRVPEPASDGNFTINFWLFGEGYKEEEDSDRLCFEDIKTDKHCIEKDKAFTVHNSKNTGIFFTVDDGNYRMNKEGKIVKMRD